MKKFEKVNKPIEGDFYSIVEQDGKKYIHVNGYIYKSDSEEFVSKDNPNGIYWAEIEVNWFVFELSHFIKEYNENGNEWVDSVYTELSQYQDDCNEEKIVDYINHYFDGDIADAYLDFDELTEDTPCGNYVSLN